MKNFLKTAKKFRSPRSNFSIFEIENFAALNIVILSLGETSVEVYPRPNPKSPYSPPWPLKIGLVENPEKDGNCQTDVGSGRPRIVKKEQNSRAFWAH